MRRLDRRSDDGVALVVALVVTLICFVLATAVLADAMHNIVGASLLERRVGALDAAEAGLDWYENYLEKTAPSALATGWTGSGPYIRTVAVGSRSARLSVRYTYLTTLAGGNVLGPPFASLPLGTSPFPVDLRAEVTSRGFVGSVSRTIRANLRLQAVYGSSGGAVSGVFICELGNRFTITGQNVDVYLLPQATGGCPSTDLVVNSGQFSVSGNVWVIGGGANLTAKSFIGGNLWTSTYATIGSTGSPNSGSGCSANVNYDKVLVCGDVTALAGPVTVNPSGTVLGATSVCASCFAPNVTFPRISALTGWPAALTALPTNGYYATRAYYELPCPGTGGNQTGQVVITPSALTIAADVAIVSQCGFLVKGNFTVRSVNGRHTLYLVTKISSTGISAPGVSACTQTKNISEFKNNLDATGVNLFIYNPCELKMRNQVNVVGQIVAFKLRAQGQTTIAYRPDLLNQGTVASPSGFRVDTELYYEQ